MAWPCPECGTQNRSDLSRCACGYDLNRSWQRSASSMEREPASNEEFTAQQGAVEPLPRELALEFHGSAREYFRIWIVNLCLTLLTVGVFSAWAKVRKKRYFYSHTTLDGTPFQYLGQPLPILKGRLIAAVLFVIYYASSHLFTSLLPYVLAAGSVVAPWVIVRSTAFNTRYSAYRNMTFRFNGTYLGALRTIYAWGIIPVFLAGMLFNWWGKPAAAGIVIILFGITFPWWIRRLRGFLIEHTSFGGRNGIFSATGGQFFKVYFASGFIILAISAVTAVVFGLFAAAGGTPFKNPQIMALVFLVPVYAGYVLAFAYVQAHSSNLVLNHTHLGPVSFRSTLRGRGMAKLYITNALGIVLSLGLLIPWAVMRTLRYRVDHLQVHLNGELSSFQGSEASAVQAAGAETLDLFDMDLSL